MGAREKADENTGRLLTIALLMSSIIKRLNFFLIVKVNQDCKSLP